MNNKKAYKHKMKKENRPGLRNFFERYEHEDENLKKLYKIYPTRNLIHLTNQMITTVHLVMILCR
ncbi:hypothetical protein [Streptococcus pseudopneumoniae]|uniref:hypothetical protein n=1 Tax=Streptococcus pseudopneumoniae TaxID=257758 RepID=UPI00061C575F|nr:hypothetical protein [Streptococcus pseudopneumoniae]CIN73086.1 Uncharacterised protein [Streptococcus pseudopneumoniae]